MRHGFNFDRTRTHGLSLDTSIISNESNSSQRETRDKEGSNVKPGLYRGMSFAEYLQLPAVNKSNLDFMRYSPAHFYAHCESQDRPPRDEPTPAMKLGTAIHTAVLEPRLFKTRYAMLPEDAPKKPTSAQLDAKKPSDATVAAIAWWERFNAELGSREVLSSENWQLCRLIRENFIKSPAAQAVLEAGEAEIVIVWEDGVEIDPVTGRGMLCKARIDLLSSVILDLKSTASARADEFAKQVVNLEWHVQAAWYSDGFERATGESKPFVFAALEKELPFASAFYLASPRVIELGRDIYRRRLARVAQCRSTGDWPGYPQEIKDLELPSWAEKELKHDITAND